MIINYGKAAPSGVDFIGSFTVKSGSPKTTELERNYKLLMVIFTGTNNYLYTIPVDALTTTNKTFCVAYGSGSSSNYRTLILSKNGDTLTIGHGSSSSTTFEIYGLY